MLSAKHGFRLIQAERMEDLGEVKDGILDTKGKCLDFFLSCCH